MAAVEDGVEMSNAVYGTSSGMHATTDGVTWRKSKITLSAVCILFGAICIILAGVIPVVIDHTIRQGVLDAARLDPKTMSDTAYAKFMNGSTGEDFYLFNITNLYDVLTNGAKINFQEVGPIKTLRFSDRYNVNWDTKNSKVEYQWLTSFEVQDDALSQSLLDEIIIGPNVFFLGMAAQVMRQVIAGEEGIDPTTSTTWVPTAEFPGNYLSEKVAVAGFFGGSLLPAVIPVFQNATSSALLIKLRAASLSTYAAFVNNFIPQVPTLDRTTALTAWATKTAYLSLYVPNYFYGFELDTALVSTNKLLIAQNVFNSSNSYGIASTAGLLAWSTFADTSSSDSTYSTQATAIAVGLGIDTTSLATMVTDLTTIGTWIKKFTTALPDTSVTSSVGNSFQLVVCSAINSEVSTYITSGSGTTNFALAFDNAANYSVSTWEDIGALQFGSGLVVALAYPGATPLIDGIGYSSAQLSALTSRTGLPDQTVPFNFADGATDAEPMEFTSGIAYYVKHNNIATVPSGWPASYSQAVLWQANPALLWVNGVTGPYINLNVIQTKQFFAYLLASSSNYGALLTALSTVSFTYATYFKNYYAATSSIATGILYGNQYAHAALAAADLSAVGITTTNWYAVYAYLYHYLGNELGGTLAQLDPTTGIAPQNAGLFTKMTVREMLFGKSGETGDLFAGNSYQRFPGVSIPSIAGPIRSSATYQEELAYDLSVHTSRTWIQDTGHANIDTVGQWVQYEGTKEYTTACDLNDKPRTSVCSPAGSNTEASNNWVIWGAECVMEGSGSSLQVQPFLESTSKRLASTSFYVGEIRRPVVCDYVEDVEIKGITVRRYMLNEALINESYGTQPNTQRNSAVWKQGNVPTGLFSQQTVKGGVPALASLPAWAKADPAVWEGCTCNGADCSLYYNATLHDTVVDIHPLTGLTLNGHKRLQANFRISAQEYFTGSAAVPTPAAGYPAASTYYPADFPSGYANTTAPGGLNFMYNNLFNHAETLADIYDVITDVDAKKLRNSEHDIKIARRARTAVIYAGYIGGSLILIAAVLALIHFIKTVPRKVA